MGCRSFFELARWSSHLRRSAKVLNSTEDAHRKSMSMFETDEHLQVCRSAAPLACEPPPVVCEPWVWAAEWKVSQAAQSAQSPSWALDVRLGMTHRTDNRSTATSSLASPPFGGCPPSSAKHKVFGEGSTTFPWGRAEWPGRMSFYEAEAPTA